MRIYVCWTARELNIPGRKHPCATAHEALLAAGHEPEVVYAKSFGALPDRIQTKARRRVRENTGSSWVPALETPQGEWISGSERIAAWAEENPAALPAGA